MSIENYEAYCFRCKTKKHVKNPEIRRLKTGMNAVQGTCIDCDGKVYRILPKDEKAEE